MWLNSSKFVILTLLVLFVAGCVENTPEGRPISTTVPPQSPSPTTPVTPFPTAPQLSKTPEPTRTEEITASTRSTVTATFLPPNTELIPNPDKYIWKITVEGFSRPTGLASPIDESNRLFVTEQNGLIHIIQAGEVLPLPFLDLRERVSTQGSTVRGLLGMTFHPKYLENGYFFVHYTQKGGDSVIARYRVSGEPNMADPSSETRLLVISYPIGEHIGGGMAFGPDGALYISIGDGGAGGNGDQAGNAQNPGNYPGSLLRMDVDKGTEPEIWAFGLRNPWRFSFDALNGDLYIADVGENRWEEINYLPAGNPAGANFGWNFYEGNEAYKGESPESLKTIFPIWTYDHTLGCSVTGGYVYRGKSLSEWFGVYIYGDYCSGNVWGLLHNADGSWQNKLLYQLPAYITSFGQDQAGEIYLVSITGKVYKFVEK